MNKRRATMSDERIREIRAGSGFVVAEIDRLCDAALDARAKLDALRALGHGVDYDASDIACDDPECCICAVLDCPHAEPLHHHHDGCPACTQEGE